MVKRLLALITLCACAAGCGRGKPAVHVQYLEIWANELNRQFEQVGMEWGRKTGHEVTFKKVALSDLPQAVSAFIEVRGTANLAVVPATRAVIHWQVLVDPSAVVEKLATAGHPPYDVVKAMNYSGGRWVAIPLYSWSHIWVWRGDLLKAHNLALPESLAAAASVFAQLNDSERGISGFGIGLGGDDDSRMFLQSVLWSFGGSIFDKEGNVVLDSPATRAAVEYVLGLYRQHLLPEGVLGWDGASNNRAFLAGTIAATANAPTILYAARRQDKDLAKNVVHSLYPPGPAGRHTFATGFSMVVRRDDPEREAALDLASYYVQPENYRRLLSAAEGSVNPQFKGYEDLPVWSDPRLAVALKSLEYEHPVGWPGPVTEAAAEVFERHVLTDILGRVITGGLTVDQAVKEAAQRVEDIRARVEK